MGARAFPKASAGTTSADGGGGRGSKLRSHLIDNHLSHVWLGRERLPFMHREGWTGTKLVMSALPYAWFVFDPAPHPATFGYTVRRISWRGE